MKTFLSIILVLLIILWALGYFVFMFTSAIHFLLLIAAVVLWLLNKKFNDN
ncbi:DUF5670 family protein [Winogradskyella marina]|uniref:DUF5670 family protein n=1 Tax=Winogradskyella marina TaxID=2785530 RepID=UPI001E52C59B|nr:DUF5670 family protein [Winogradskyella marina]